MNWNNYYEYLKNNAVNQKLNGRFFVKYSLIVDLGLDSSPEEEQKEFDSIINNLMLSLQATIDDDDSVYHLLPDYNSEKNWEGQIPTDIKLGKNNLLNTSKISPKVYTILALMFNEWQSSQENEEEETEKKRQEKLEEQLNSQLHENPIDKEVEELMGYSFISNLSKKTRKKFLAKWETWLSNYNQLTEERQASWKKELEQVNKLINLLKDASPEKEKIQEGNWLTNLPWNNIALYGGGIVIILFILNWLKVKITDK